LVSIVMASAVPCTRLILTSRTPTLSPIFAIYLRSLEVKSMNLSIILLLMRVDIRVSISGKRNS
jgi:hypothetical protein